MRANSSSRFTAKASEDQGRRSESRSIRVFGESRIDTKGLSAPLLSVRMFGEAKVSLNATDEVHLTGLGETNVSVKGDAIISKGLVIRSRIRCPGVKIVDLLSG